MEICKLLLFPSETCQIHFRFVVIRKMEFSAQIVLNFVVIAAVVIEKKRYVKLTRKLYFGYDENPNARMNSSRLSSPPLEGELFCSTHSFAFRCHKQQIQSFNTQATEMHE